MKKKRHANLLVFAGAFIVFVTYVVREGLYEHWTETAKSIETARDVYLGRALTIGSSVALSTQLAIQSSENMKGGDPKQTFSRTTLVVADDIGTKLTVVLELTENLELLAQDIPDGEAIVQQLIKLENDIQAATKQNTDFRQELARVALSPTTRLKSFKSLDNRLDAIVDDSVSLFNRNAELQAQVSERTKTILERNKAYSRRSWYVSAALFVVGWVLGLFGKLYGVETGVGGAE